MRLYGICLWAKADCAFTGASLLYDSVFYHRKSFILSGVCRSREMDSGDGAAWKTLFAVLLSQVFLGRKYPLKLFLKKIEKIEKKVLPNRKVCAIL